MKSILSVSVFMLSFFSLFSANTGDDHVVLYKAQKYKGDRITITHSWSALDPQDSWNDAIESIRIPPGWEVWVYEHSYFRGNHLVLTSNWNGKSNRRWRNCISSVKVVRKDGHSANHDYYRSVPVTIFEDDNFDGNALRINREWTITNSNEFWNDQISSIYVPEGYRIIVYEHSYFRGRSMTLESSWSAPRGKNWWNDQISSIKVERK